MASEIVSESSPLTDLNYFHANASPLMYCAADLTNLSNLIVSYNATGYPYPRTAIPKLDLQSLLILEKDSDYEPIVNYGYPPPPKPPEPISALSPLCSPCPSPVGDEEDGNLKDLDDEDLDPHPEEAIISLEENDRSAVSSPLAPPPLPPEFPFSTLQPPPTPPEFPWPTPPTEPIKIVSTSSTNSSSKRALSYMDNLPAELLKLCQPLFCKLCIQNLPSQVISERHYKSRRHKLNTNDWLQEHNYSDRLVRVQPIGKDPNYKQKLLLSAAKKEFEWKEADQEINFSSELPQELRDMFQPLICKLCHVKHFSRTHAMDHYSSRDHFFRIRVYLGLVDLVPERPKKKKKHTYWNYMKKYHLGTFSGKTRVARSGSESGNSYGNQIETQGPCSSNGGSLIIF